MKGFTVNELVIVLAILGILAVSTTGCPNVHRSLMERYTISGVVDGEINGKITIQTSDSGSSSSQKFAVPLREVSVVEGFRPLKYSGASGIFNCSSTQCAGLKPGATVLLSCFDEFHIAEPNEEECRFQAMK